jgi:hypothetical protein
MKKIIKLFFGFFLSFYRLFLIHLLFGPLRQKDFTNGFSLINISIGKEFKYSAGFLMITL